LKGAEDMKNRVKSLLAIVLFISLSLSSVAFADTSDTSSVTLPNITSPSAILVEASTGKVLYSKNPDAKMYPASMTKLMTSLVLLDYFKPDDIITVGSEINDVSLDSSKAGHVRGEALTVQNLIRGLLIPSGNDSAVVAATAVAKKVENNDSLSEKDCEKIFADLMNKKAEKLGCKNTHFVNPHGYHDENHYTCATDMSLIAAEALKNDTIKEIGSEKSYSGNGLGNLKSSHPELKTQDYSWVSHNKLIMDNQYKYEYADGLKTGYTDEAGDCLTATAKKDGVRLIAIIFDSPDPGRWLDAASLFNYGFSNYEFYKLNKSGDTVAKASLVYNKSSDGNTLDLVVKKDITLFLNKKEVNSITHEVKITNESLLTRNRETDENELPKLMAPITSDTEIGTVDYKTSDGTVLASAKLYASRDVQKASLIGRIFYNAKTLALHVFNGKTSLKVIIAIIIIIIIILLILLLKRRRHSYYSRSVYRYKPRRRHKW
jgi:D-alanyl-D-alanine carboxypeptidase (penicillin-binding protein 5/6)